MDTLEQLLMQLMQLVSEAKKSMFSSTDVVVNRAEVLDIIDRVRAAYPEVIKEAQYIVQEAESQKQRTLEYCGKLVKEAEARRDSLLDENDIIRQANEEASAVRKEMLEMRARVEYEVKCKVDDVLKDSEVTLRDALTLIRNNREELRNSEREVAPNSTEASSYTANNPNA